MSSSQVHKVFHSGVAAQEGSIREGDQVLSINGTSLCGYIHWEALRVLRRAKCRDLGVVVLRRGGTSSACKGGAQTNGPGPTQAEATETGKKPYLNTYFKLSSSSWKGLTVFFCFCCSVRWAPVCASGEEQQGSGVQPGGRCGLQSGEQTTHCTEDLPGWELNLSILDLYAKIWISYKLTEVHVRYILRPKVWRQPGSVHMYMGISFWLKINLLDKSLEGKGLQQQNRGKDDSDMLLGLISIQHVIGKRFWTMCFVMSYWSI